MTSPTAPRSSSVPRESEAGSWTRQLRHNGPMRARRFGRDAAAVIAVVLMLAACGSGVGDLAQRPETGAGTTGSDEGAVDEQTGPDGGDTQRDDAPGSGDPRASSSVPDAARPDGSIPIDPGPLEGTDALEPSASMVAPTGWILYAARAEVTVPGGTVAFGGAHSQCSNSTASLFNTSGLTISQFHCLVEVSGIEPPTSSLRTTRSSQLSYTPGGNRW